MIRTLVYLAVLALAAYGAALLADRPGTVALEWDGWRLDSSVAMLALAVAVVAIVLAALLRLTGIVRHAPRNWALARRARRRERGYRALTHGMVAVAAGDSEEAHRQARRALALLDDPPLTMLLSAQAAQLAGDEAAARRYFTAMLERPETAFLGLRGLLMQAERAGDKEEARRLIERAFAMRPNTPWVVTALLEEQTKGQRWRDALDTVLRAEKAGTIPRAEARAKEAALYVALAEQEREAGDGVEARALARKAQKLAPEFLPAAIVRASLLAREGHKRAANKILETTWAKTPHPELARIAARMGDGDALARSRRVEKLVDTNPQHRESRLALAEAALDARLWGVARAQLAPLAADSPTAHVCRLMARLEAEEKNDTTWERAWLLRAANAAPDPAWVCGACGGQAASWSSLCPHCSAFATLSWRAPDVAASPALARAPAPAAPSIDAPAPGA
jgi:HemY protein